MLIGNVGDDPKVRYLEPNPQNPAAAPKVATFRLATSERFRDRNGELRENTEWHSIVAWRNSADVCEKFVHKGTQLFIEGKLRSRQWTDQNGGTRYVTEIVVDNLQLLSLPRLRLRRFLPRRRRFRTPRRTTTSRSKMFNPRFRLGIRGFFVSLRNIELNYGIL